ncbi:MAG: UbiA family prenyltransferase [Elusimicrobia bacterium]|nr:UbiA family prenyltransferase [Elusimicrobiota bacterium]
MLAPMPAAQTPGGVPFCADLDGTLIKTDLLAESLLAVVRARPWEGLKAPLWLLGGRAALKRRAAERAALDVALLPYREEMLDLLKKERAAGRRVLLVTAADESLARAVADHLGLFDGVVASDGVRNRVGAEKLRALRALIGEGPFDYAGDSRRDLPLFEAARESVVVGPDAGLLRAVRGLGRPARSVAPERAGPRVALESLRCHQWAKNLLVFVPIVAAHRLGDLVKLRAAVLTFLGLSFCASSVYVINDVLDLPNDRRNPSKRTRPFASGRLPLSAAPRLVSALMLLTAAVAWLLPLSFLALAAGYLTLALAYCLVLKRAYLVDVLCLAGLYTLRLFAGHVVPGIEGSAWLLNFSVFMFLSLAVLKRFEELRSAGSRVQGELPGRAYRREDISFLSTFGLIAGCLATLVFMLYINSPKAAELYRRQWPLWFISPLMLYWVVRIWFLTNRGDIGSDLVRFVLKDRVSWSVAAAVGALMAVASR